MEAFAYYDPTSDRFSKDQHDPLFSKLGQVWPLVRIRQHDLDPAEVESLRVEVAAQKILLNEFMNILAGSIDPALLAKIRGGGPRQ